MRPISLGLAVLAGLIATVPAVSQEEATAFLCIPDKSTGFKYIKTPGVWEILGVQETPGVWESVNFDVSEKKYLIKRDVDQEKYEWEVSLFGAAFSRSSCKEDFNASGFLFCDGIWDFRFNRDNLRFLSIYRSGYYAKA